MAILAVRASSGKVNSNSNDDNSRLPNSSFGLETNCLWLSTPDSHLCAKEPIENLGNWSLAYWLIKKISLPEPCYWHTCSWFWASEMVIYLFGLNSLIEQVDFCCSDFWGSTKVVRCSNVEREILRWWIFVL